jgi:hypothetical protein
MNNPNHFESKIREKLDNNQVVYQESYWKAYNETYPLHWYQKIRFSWKSHAIFGYSLFAFSLGYLFNSSNDKKSIPLVTHSVAATDTVITVKGITHKDSVYIQEQKGPSVIALVADERQGTVFNAALPELNSVQNGPSVQKEISKIASIPERNAANNPSSEFIGTSKMGVVTNKQDTELTIALAQESLSGSSRYSISPEKKENTPVQSTDFSNFVSAEENEYRHKNGGNSASNRNFRVQNGHDHRLIDSNIAKELVTGESRATAAATQTLDSSYSKISARVSSINVSIEGVDTSKWEDSEIVKMNQKKSSKEWGLGLNTAVFLPFVQGEVSYKLGIYGGIDVRVKRNRWSVHTGLLYGVNFVKIDAVDRVDISVADEFVGFKDLYAAPENLRMVTQTMAPHIGLEYALLNTSKFGIGISAGILGILPIDRLFIYDYIGQSQIRTRESLPGMDPFKLMPNTGLTFWYQPRYDWQIELGAKLFPTMIGSTIHEANAVAPVAIQLGVLKYW